MCLCIERLTTNVYFREKKWTRKQYEKWLNCWAYPIVDDAEFRATRYVQGSPRHIRDPYKDPSSNICENEGTGPTPSGHTHYLNKVFKMHLVKGCGMKEWAPPYYFHIYCEECLGGYVYQFWSINSKKCNICDPLIKNCQTGVWYFMWGTVCNWGFYRWKGKAVG